MKLSLTCLRSLAPNRKIYLQESKFLLQDGCTKNKINSVSRKNNSLSFHFRAFNYLGKDILELLSAMNIKLENLSEQAVGDINFIAGVSSSLRLNEPSLPQYFFQHLFHCFQYCKFKLFRILSALEDISNKKFHHQLVSISIEDEEKRLSDLNASQMTIQFQLKRLLEEKRSKTKVMVEEAIQNRQTENFYEKKCAQYLESIDKCLETLKSHGFDEAFTHRSLVEHRKNIDDVQAKSNSLKTELESFQNLPPDIISAKEELEKLKAELVTLDEMITHASAENNN